MKKSSKAGKSNNSQIEKNQELFRKLVILEQDYWRSLEKPNNPKHKRRNSTSSYGGCILAPFDQLQLLENSPRELMSSLQSKISPFDAIPNTGNYDVAEVIMDRRGVIMSGKLKGRRLVFDSIEAENEVALGWDYKDDSGVVMQEREVIMNENCDGKISRSRSRIFSSLTLAEEEKTVVEVGNVSEKGCYRRLRAGGGGRCMVVAMAWLVIFCCLWSFLA